MSLPSRLFGSIAAALLLYAAAILLFLLQPAQASLTNPAAVNKSTTVTGSSSQILPADSSRRYLLIVNVCSQNIGISITGTTAAIGTAGTVTLFPGGSMEFTGRDVPQNALNGISASGTCGVTIWEIR